MPDPAATPTGDLASAEQYFSSSSPLPNMPPQSGSAMDAIWGPSTPFGRILSKAGYGVTDNLGSVEVSPDERQAMVKAGIFNDYNAGHQNFVKSAAEVLLRPAIHLANALGQIPQLPGAILGGIQGAAEQTGEEISPGVGPANPVRQAAAYPFRALGEAAGSAAGGALAGESFNFAEEARVARETDAAVSARAALQDEHLNTATQARAMGVIGEGEAGYYDAAPLAPEDVQARAESAQEAGITAPPPAPPPDIHELARRVDPDTFDEFDALAQEREQHRQTIANLGAERENSSEATEAKADIHRIIGGETGSDEERGRRIDAVRASAPDPVIAQLDDAQRRLESALTRDTPEMTAARTALMDADFKMRDLAPAVSDAYRQAADMAPHLAEEAENAASLGEPQKPGEQPAQELSRGPQSEAPPEAVQASSEAAGIEPPSVTGEQKLGEEGPPPVKTGQARYGDLRAVEGTGDLQGRGLSEHVEAKAIEDGLTDNFGDLPEYRTLSMADQAAQVQKLMDTDYEGAKAIAMGDRAPPKGVLPESVFVGVEKRALAEGDVDTIRQLATRSRLNTAATTMGQRIRTLGERDRTSPVGMIQEVQAAREAELARRSGAGAKADEVKAIKAEVKKAASKPDAWADFIRSIQCGE